MPEQRTKPDTKFAKQVLQDEDAKKMGRNRDHYLMSSQVSLSRWSYEYSWSKPSKEQYLERLFQIEAPPHQEDQVDAPYSTTAKALSDLNKLVACERRGEIKSILEKEKSWKTEVSEYVSIPQWLQKASSKMDESADEIDTLLTVLNVLRAHKITTVPRERKNQGSTRLAWTSQGNDQISVSKNNGKRI